MKGMKGLWIPLVGTSMMLASSLLSLPTWARIALTVGATLLIWPSFLRQTSRGERWLTFICVPIVMGLTVYLDLHPEFSLATRRLLAVPTLAAFFVWIVGFSGGVRWIEKRRASQVMQ